MGVAFFLFFSAPRAKAMSYTYLCRAPLDWKGAVLSGLQPISFEEGLFKTSASSSIFLSRVISSPIPFDQLIGSWNANVPAYNSLRMEARVQIDNRWTPWFILGTQKGSLFFSHKSEKKSSIAFVDIDTLKLKKSAHVFQYRVLFSSPKKPTILKLLAVNVSNPEGYRQKPLPFKPGPWVRELKVQARSQMQEEKKYRRNVCSPTSLGMALDYWKISIRTAKIAEAVRDQTTLNFGDWTFNTAFAGSLGLVSYVSRFDDLTEVEKEIAKGRPVIASVSFKAGELPRAPIQKTAGHLLVIVGFTKTGDVIVNDPAAPNASSVRRVYPRASFDKAWRINKRGLVYLLSPLKGLSAIIGVPVSDLMSQPTPKLNKLKVKLDDPKHLSQLLYGEKITILKAKGQWVEIAADEQMDFRNGRWQGYQGWIEAKDISFALNPPPNSVVRIRQAILHRGQEFLNLSVGTRLRKLGNNGSLSIVQLPDDTTAEIDSSALYPYQHAIDAQSRAEIIRTAELFLGTSYYWGGRSGVQPDLSIGVDCSGLVNLAYRVIGIDIPRDSFAQKLKSLPIKNTELKIGDLIFLTDPKNKKRISHVMIYTGGDGFIESRKSSGQVLRSSFQERFGHPLREIATGSEVTDYSYPSPKKRFIYFGSYLDQPLHPN